MAKTKTEHCVMRNGKMFCMNCGGEQVTPMPIDVRMFSAMAKEFGKIHRNCAKTWKQPEVDQSLPEYQKAIWWLEFGERGISSETIYSVIAPTVGQGEIRHSGSYCHPCDAGDFRRCYLLLKTVPEWRAKLHLMKDVSPVWSKLVDNWDELTRLLEEMILTDKPSPQMGELLEKCGC